MDGRFIAYYRVSTAKQGRSGLGLDAQRSAVNAYLNGGKWKVIAEFTEIESGRKSDRPALAQALAACRVHRCPLVVAKVDRLTRSAAFLGALLATGVDVRFCDLPQIEGPTGRFMLTQMAAVAELEAGLISARTKAALQAAKARGVKLGGTYRGIDARAREISIKARAELANNRAHDLASTIAELKASGHVTYAAIANGLNELGVPTSRGKGAWHKMQVKRVLDRLSA